MKLKLFILSLLLFLSVSLPVNATILPKNMKDFLILQKNIPSVRYDGVIVYNNDLMYIPVIPAYPKEVDNIQIVKTYPNNLSMNSFPDIVVFNNNYSLLKVSRVNNNTLSAKTFSELPLEVKTGTIPQDIMVPKGLVLPECFAGILGDVQIPLVGSAKAPSFVSAKKSAPLPNGKRTSISEKKYSVPSALKDKIFFVNNFQTEYLEIFSSSVSEPLYSLKTSGVMKDVKPVLDGKYLLVATNKQKNIDVVDVNDEYIIKNISLTSNPSEIAVDDIHKKAYVASTQDDSLYVIDLESMSIKEKIQLIGAPQKLSISDDGKQIAYVDIKSSNVYILDLENDYENKLITRYPNVTKLILKDNVIYMIARTQPQLRIVDYDLYQNNNVAKTRKDKRREKEKEDDEKENIESVTSDIYTEFDTDKMFEDDEDELMEDSCATSIRDIKIGNKPIDMLEENGRVYVLCAGDNTVYTYIEGESIVLDQKLPVEGFTKSFTKVPNSNLAVITNMGDLNYVVYDMSLNKPIQTQPISEYINMITILERKNGQ